MADDKILHPLIQEDASFPGEVISTPSGSSGGGKEQIFTPTISPEQTFPVRQVASELISHSLDTLSRKILGEFQFTTMGAIKIGQISISEDGILGEDINGNTTFGLDPDTGSATFKGTILAGTVIAGAVLADYIQVGGAAGDVNAGSTTISGSKLTTGTVTADYVVASISITSPTISGGSIAIGSADSIFKADSNGIYLGNATFASAPFRVTMAGAVTASNITITGGSLAVGTNGLHVDTSGNMWWGSSSTYAGATIKISSAGSIDFTTGTFSGVYSGSVNASQVNAGTLTGFTIQTASSGQRMVMQADITGSIDGIIWYDSGGGPSYLYGDNDGNLVWEGGDFNINGVNLNNINTLDFDERSSAPSNDDALFYYHSGATYRFQTRMESGNWSIDQTGV